MVGKAKELPPGLSRSVQIAGRRIALFNDGGRLHAVDASCPHMGADLSNGDLEEGTLSCAWHGWRFDLASGEGLTRSWARLRRHRLSREGEDLVLEILEPPAGEAGGGEPPPEDGGR